MEGYRIDLSAYEYVDTVEVVDGENRVLLDDKAVPVDPRRQLPKLITNANIKDPKFDVYELGKIAERIKGAKEDIVLDSEDYKRLKERTTVIAKVANGVFFEMIRRVMEPKKVTLKADD